MTDKIEWTAGLAWEVLEVTNFISVLMGRVYNDADDESVYWMGPCEGSVPVVYNIRERSISIDYEMLIPPDVEPETISLSVVADLQEKLQRIIEWCKNSFPDEHYYSGPDRAKIQVEIYGTPLVVWG